MSMLQGDAAGAESAEATKVVRVEEEILNQSWGPPMQVAPSSHAGPSQAQGRLTRALVLIDDVRDRTRPAVVGVLLLGAIGAAVLFAWQSRFLGEGSSIDSIEGSSAIASEVGGQGSTADASGRADGEFDATDPDDDQVAVASEELGILEIPERSTNTSAGGSSSSTATSSTTVARPSTTAPATSAPASTATLVSSTATTVKSTTTTTEPTTTTTEPTTTTTEPTTTSTAAPVVNPTGNFVLVNAATGRCASGQRDRIDQQRCGEDSNQTFRFELLNSGMRITEIKTGNVLDVRGSSSADGAEVIPWPWHGRPNQLWNVQPVGANYAIVSMSSGKCVAMNGGTLYQETCSNAATQLWTLS